MLHDIKVTFYCKKEIGLRVQGRYEQDQIELEWDPIASSCHGINMPSYFLMMVCCIWLSWKDFTEIQDSASVTDRKDE